MLVRGVLRACPVCGQRGLFHRWLDMVEDCPRCRLHFERIEGHWLGAVGINTIVTLAALVVSLVVSLYLGYPEFPMVPLISVNLAVAVVVPVAFYGSSKTLWTAIDIILRPLEAYEVDWTRVRP
jgi:uncharacterized protein (DUF983 family)